MKEPLTVSQKEHKGTMLILSRLCLASSRPGTSEEIEASQETLKRWKQ